MGAVNVKWVYRLATSWKCVLPKPSGAYFTAVVGLFSRGGVQNVRHYLNFDDFSTALIEIQTM